MIVVEDLKVRRGSFVLEVPYLEVHEGECLVVLGPSGAGKTTLLKSLAGLIPIESGRILVDGEDVTRMPPEKRGFAYVPQNYALFPHMSVWNNIAFGLRIRKMSRDLVESRVRGIARALGIENLLDRFPHQLSAGQQQRVALARALVVEPRALLLDEPLANIDPAMRGKARQFIKQLLEKLRVTAIYATHSIVDAVTLGRRIVYIDSGKLRFQGDVYTFLKTEYVRPYLEEIADIVSILLRR